MRKVSILISAIALCSVGMFAQDDLPQYQTAMKAAAGANGAAKAAVAANDSAAIATQAKILAENFDMMSQILAKHSKDDAVKIANTARDAAKELGSATTPELQAKALQEIGGTCRACHSIARDGNNFKQ